jgi:hypothetical protein
MANSYILTKELAMRAIDIAAAAFLKLVDLEISDRHKLHVVVMDPSKRPQFGDTFEESILCEKAIGDEVKRFREGALGKAHNAWLYAMPTQEIQQFYPHLYAQGMNKWGGGTYLHHIAVGAAGVDYQYDQWMAEMVACTCRALAVGKMARIFTVDSDVFE